MQTARQEQFSQSGIALYMALELGEDKWVVAFTTGLGQASRNVTIPARDVARLREQIAKAKRRFKLDPGTPVFCCYEAGRDGFWVHRSLATFGVGNVVVDASSIEVNRRKRRAKCDRLDADKLATMLVRYHLGERTLWKIVNVPTPEQEDLRQPHRERITLTQERTAVLNRIKGLLIAQGLKVAVDAKFPEVLPSLRMWNGEAVGARLQQQLLRDFQRVQVLDRQIGELHHAERHALRDDRLDGVQKARVLFSARGVGAQSAWLLTREVFGWRQIRNRRQLGALAGLVSTPYASGQSNYEQGISKAGNKRIRWLMVQLAWSWLHWQPDSKLSRWFVKRFGGAGKRQRKIGIVALARKLLIALWRLAEFGEIPDGAVMSDWEVKLAAG